MRCLLLLTAKAMLLAIAILPVLGAPISQHRDFDGGNTGCEVEVSESVSIPVIEGCFV